MFVSINDQRSVVMINRNATYSAAFINLKKSISFYRFHGDVSVRMSVINLHRCFHKRAISTGENRLDMEVPILIQSVCTKARAKFLKCGAHKNGMKKR
jgi:hypothetical protein